AERVDRQRRHRTRAGVGARCRRRLDRRPRPGRRTDPVHDRRRWCAVSLSRRSFLAAGSLAALGADGCGNRRYEQARGTVPDEYRKRVHVVFWHAYASVYGEVLAGLAKRFNESQSEVYVETQFQGTY